MARLCPACGSDKTGGSPKRWKDYTPDRGRLDIDYMRCDVCGAAWDNYRYVHEEVNEVHDVRTGDGSRPEWGAQPPRRCKNCKGTDVRWQWSDGAWHRPGTEILRYKCNVCKQIWQEMVNEATGEVLARRVWEFGQKINQE